MLPIVIPRSFVIQKSTSLASPDKGLYTHTPVVMRCVLSRSVQNTAFHSSTACHTSWVSPNACFDWTVWSEAHLWSVHSQGSLSLCKANSAKNIGGRERPNCLLLPALVWVRRSCLEERVTVNLTEEKLGIPVFGEPSGGQGRLGCERKRTNIQETLSTRKTKTAPRKLWQDCQTQPQKCLEK